MAVCKRTFQDTTVVCMKILWAGEACQSRGPLLAKNVPLLIKFSYPNGSLAQLVEQRPEEPCVPSSSLGVATNKRTP